MASPSESLLSSPSEGRAGTPGGRVEDLATTVSLPLEDRDGGSDPAATAAKARSTVEDELHVKESSLLLAMAS